MSVQVSFRQGFEKYLHDLQDLKASSIWNCTTRLTKNCFLSFLGKSLKRRSQRPNLSVGTPTWHWFLLHSQKPTNTGEVRRELGRRAVLAYWPSGSADLRVRQPTSSPSRNCNSWPWDGCKLLIPKLLSNIKPKKWFHYVRLKEAGWIEVCNKAKLILWKFQRNLGKPVNYHSCPGLLLLH